MFFRIALTLPLMGLFMLAEEYGESEELIIIDTDHIDEVFEQHVNRQGILDALGLESMNLWNHKALTEAFERVMRANFSP